MALTSLLVCADAKAVQVLSRILQELSIDVEHCSDPHAAVARLAGQRFDAIVVDCADEQAAIELFVAARRSTANRTTLAVAMVDNRSQVRDVFANGANFVLYKPVTAERAASSLRAARSLMRRERRRNQRIPLHTDASITYGSTENAAATLVELSESGVAIQSGRRLPPACKVYFQFTLPGHVSLVRLSGEVMWQDASGRVGIRFVDVPQTSRRVLTEWLQANVSRQAETAQTAAPVAGSDGAQPPAQAPAGLGLHASSSDRRIRSRRACRLGADVFRLGSPVPYRCSLSDIGTGGCYVETTEPFVPGTGVEIVVRTRDFKLRVRGTVQTMHQGCGMGVQFSLQTADERRQVEQLIACQAAEPGITV